MDSSSSSSASIAPIESYATYEDYLDSQVSETDIFYLEVHSAFESFTFQSQDIARQLVELGCRGSGDTVSREEFERKKLLAKERSSVIFMQEKQSAKLDNSRTNSKFLQEVFKRDELLSSGKLAVCVVMIIMLPQTIIYMRAKNSKGQEVSGYIDLAQRLQSDEASGYYDGSIKLSPKPSDLSYYNWKTQVSRFNSSTNFQVITDDPSGQLTFKNKRDRKVIVVDHELPPGDNTTRTEVEADIDQFQVIFFDHLARRRA